MFMISGMVGLGGRHMGYEAQYWAKTWSEYELLWDEKL